MSDGMQTETGAWVDADDLGGGVKVPRVKIQYGDDGSATDVADDAGLPVRIGGPTVLDYSATLTGDSDTIVTAGQAGHYLAIQNPTGNADVVVNLAGGDVAVSGITLVAGGSLTIDQGVANAVTIKGTADQSVVVFAG